MILKLANSMVMTGVLAMASTTWAMVHTSAFNLPDVIFAAPGLECNVYYGSAFDAYSSAVYTFETVGEVGQCQNERWTWTPTEKDGGTRHRLVFNAWSDFGPLVSRTVTVVVAKAKANPTRRVTFALLADSLTNARYQDRILAAMKASGWSQFTPIGSRSGSSAELWGVYKDGEAAHDGYGGFTPGAFLTRYEFAVDEIDNLQSEAEKSQLKAFGVDIPAGQEWRRGLLKSPLVRYAHGKKSVDVQSWLNRVNGGKAPDYLVIELGVNGTCTIAYEDLPDYCNRVQVADMRRLVGELRKVAPKTVIAIAACLVGADQDSHGRNYGCSINALRAHRNIYYLNTRWQALVKELRAKGDANVFYVPFGSAISPQHGYIRETVPVFAHSSVQVERINNACHPSLEGGKQLGDALAAFLQWHLGVAK